MRGWSRSGATATRSSRPSAATTAAGSEERVVDQVVVEHGTLPADDLYHALRPQSSNLGAVDYEALVAGRPQAVVRNPAGAFRLFRIGDAVASRNIHAAVYDGLRYAKDI